MTTDSSKETKTVTFTADSRAIVHWQDEEEQILREWADKAMCFKWLHSKSHEIFSYQHAMFTIPVIIISTITGTANFALERFGEDTKSIAVMFIGGLNIMTGIISTVAQFLKIAEINEGHRVAAIAWDKFYRLIKIELAKASKDRRSPKELIRQCQEEYDRLVETSPTIKQKVISEFNKLEIADEIQKPEICGEFMPIHIHNSLEDHVKETAIQSVKKDIKDQLEIFKNEFFKLNGRYPTVSEMDAKFSPKFHMNKESKSSQFMSSSRRSMVAPATSMREIVIEDEEDGKTSVHVQDEDEMTGGEYVRNLEVITEEESDSS